MNTTRFLSASSHLALGNLLRRGRRALLAGLALAISAHLGLSRIAVQREDQKAAKPLTTQFVKRQPRLTKPLELKKRPQPKRRTVQRQMVAVKARATSERVSVGVEPGGLVRNLSRPKVQVGRFVEMSTANHEPEALAASITGVREDKRVVDMSLEMIDIDAMDTGQYQAMVVQDPNDKRNIKGYMRLAMAYPYSVRQRNASDVEDRVTNGVRRLIARLNQWTDIRSSVGQRVAFDSAELFQTPWVYLWVYFGLDPTRTEIEGLGKYLLNGGFFFFGGGNWRETQGERHMKRFVESALESQGLQQGAHWEYQSLPPSHPIFHCYYDFPGGTPVGHLVLSYRYYKVGREDGLEPWCKGIEIDGRLLALNENQAYWCCWGDWGPGGLSRGVGIDEADPTLQFQFGINTIVFALTQEGSITQRLMQSVD